MNIKKNMFYGSLIPTAVFNLGYIDWVVAALVIHTKDRFYRRHSYVLLQYYSITGTKEQRDKASRSGFMT